MSNLKDKTIWLTGASSGIGEALYYELIKRGANVAITSRRKGVLEDLNLKANHLNNQTLVCEGDIEDLASLKEIVKRITAHFGALDIVIANAGTHIFTWPESFDSKEYISLMNLNYGGTLKTIEAAMPEFINAKKGHIVGVASLAGYRGLPKAGAYGASKAALINFLESIRFQLKKINIKVTIVNPGFVKTPLTDKNDFYMPFLVTPEKSAEIICAGIEQEKYEIAYPFPFNIILKIARILPYRVYEFITDKMW